MLKKYAILTAAMAFLLLLSACGSSNEENQNAGENKQEGQPQVDIDEDELQPDDEVVAVVNGNEIQGRIYNMVYSQLKLSASQMGDDVDQDDLKQAAYDSLIDRELLMQKAKEDGIDITDEKAEEELKQIKENNKDGLKTVLEQYQMSEEDFKEQLKFELAMNEYKANLSDVKVTDEEVEKQYEEAKADNEDMPELEDIKPQMKQQIKERKTNEALQEEIDKVKEKADIEKKMDE